MIAPRRSCSRLVEVAGAVDLAADADLAAHLRDCADCQDEWATVLRLGALGRELPGEPDPDRLRALRAAVLAPRPRREPVPTRRVRFAICLGASLFAVSVFAAVTTRVLPRLRATRPEAAPMTAPARASRPRSEAHAPLPSPALTPAAPRSSPDHRVTGPAPHPVSRLRVAAAPVEAPALLPGGRIAAGPAELAFAQGWEAMRVGRDGEAADSFLRSATLGRDEAIAEDARYWRGVALVRLGHRKEGRAVLEEFLAHHAASPRAAEVSVMLGWLLLDQDECAAAEARFRAAAQAPITAVRDGARAGLDGVSRCRARE